MAIDGDKYPQLAQMRAVQAQSQAIGEFIEWLGENGMVICTTEDGLRGGRYYPVGTPTEALLARHFGVDLNAVERERRQVLADCVRAQAAA